MRNFDITGGTPALPGLSPNGGTFGGVWNNAGNIYSTTIWATRSLAAGADLKMNIDAQSYFSFRLNNIGDSSMGIGFSDGNSDTSQFVGIGATWNNKNNGAGDTQNNSLYYTGGTLGQVINSASNDRGPYAVLGHTAVNSLNGSALIVGKISASLSGVDTFNFKMYLPGSTITDDPDNMVWDLTYSVSSSADFTNLLIWNNGGGNGEVDAIRAGATWQDVTGVAAVPEPASACLLGLGAAFAGFRRRQRPA